MTLGKDETLQSLLTRTPVLVSGKVPVDAEVSVGDITVDGISVAKNPRVKAIIRAEDGAPLVIPDGVRVLYVRVMSTTDAALDAVVTASGLGIALEDFGEINERELDLTATGDEAARTFSFTGPVLWAQVGYDTGVDFVAPDPPVADNSAATVGELTADNILTPALAGLVTQLQILVSPTHGTAEVVDLATIKYTPTPGYTGADAITIEAANAGGSDTAVIAVTVGARTGPTHAWNVVADQAAGTTLVFDTSAAVNGQLLVAVLNISGLTRTVTPPAGWTQRAIGDSGIYGRVVILTKVAASEPATATFTMSASDTYTGAVIGINDADTTTPIDVAASYTNDTANATAHTCPAVTTATHNALALRIVGGSAGSTGTWAAPATERVDHNGGNRCLHVATEPITNPGTTGTRLDTLASARAGANATVALRGEVA